MRRSLLFVLLFPLYLTLSMRLSYAATVQLPQTGQISTYDMRDDGALRQGVAWPNPRFTNNGNGTVTDNLTGLTWLRNANCTDTAGGIAKTDGYLPWSDALTWSRNLESGKCGLTDGSTVGQWRLPNITELESLIDAEKYNPALPTSHPFSAVQAINYWSSTTFTGSTGFAWSIDMSNGYVLDFVKPYTFYVWPVRAGQYGSFGSLALSPASKDFGTVPTGDSSPAQTFTLSNSGTSSLTVTSIALNSGDSGQFSLSIGNGTGGTCGATPTIAPGGSCTVSALFAPTSAKGLATTLQIATNDPANPTKNVALSGAGLLTSYTVGVIVNGGNGSITCDSPVAKGGNSTCTISPSTNFHLATFTDNTEDKLTQVSVNIYSITNIQTDHSIYGSFAANSVNGVCGSSNGGNFTIVPAANLCTTGTPSAVTGSGPWSWSCNGNNGGTTASCSASKNSSAPTFGDANGDNNIDVFDALLTLQYALNLIQHTQENDAMYQVVADVYPLDANQKPKGDGTVDVMDALAILQRAVNLLNW